MRFKTLPLAVVGILSLTLMPNAAAEDPLPVNCDAFVKNGEDHTAPAAQRSGNGITGDPGADVWLPNSAVFTKIGWAQSDDTAVKLMTRVCVLMGGLLKCHKDSTYCTTEEADYWTGSADYDGTMLVYVVDRTPQGIGSLPFAGTMSADRFIAAYAPVRDSGGH